MNLPELYKKRMKRLLKEDYDEYIKSFEHDYHTGLRVNNFKVSTKQFEKISPFELEPINWVNNGFYYNKEKQIAKHPYYYAGLYYIQEPSAMTPASLLPIKEGDKVLDLCAAPGGKTTELGSKLKGTGLLVSNDISPSRAKALLKNIELAGITNSLVTSESSSKLVKYFEGYFDKILVDAPCSGEGMFRKDSGLISSWENRGVEYYSKLQKEIIEDAAKMLKPGGYMLYSTCTFSPEENEDTIEYLLSKFPEFSIEKVPLYEGFDKGKSEWSNGDINIEKCIRLWPHRVKGEGHFIALLKKKEQDTKNTQLLRRTKQVKLPEFKVFLELCKQLDINEEQIEVRQGKVYMLPEGLPELKGLRILRSGWYLGEEKKNRFEPSQAFAIGLTSKQFCNIVDFSAEDDEVIKYLKGETLQVEGNNGWNLICVDGFPLGWGKINNGRLKNKYAPGWRYL